MSTITPEQLADRVQAIAANPATPEMHLARLNHWIKDDCAKLLAASPEQLNNLLASLKRVGIWELGSAAANAKPAKADVQPAPDRAAAGHSASPEPVPEQPEAWEPATTEPQAPVLGTGLPTVSAFACSVFTVPLGANPIGKRVFLNADGAMEKVTLGDFNRLQCVTTNFADLKALGTFIESAEPNQHITAGICTHEKVWIVPGGMPTEKTGPLPVIHRNNTTFDFPAGPGIMVVDSDNLDLLSISATQALIEAVPALDRYSRIEMSSSGANIYGTEDFVEHRGLTGQHTVFHVADARDVPRALDVLHKRCYLAGHFIKRLSADGSFLERSPVDRQLKVPVQPIYLKVTCDESLTQAKSIKVIEGIEVLDTRAVLPDLTGEEEDAYKAKVQEVRKSMLGETKRVRAAYTKARVEKLVAEGVPEEYAEDAVKAALGKTHTLAPEWPIIASDGTKTTVGAILEAGAEAWHLRTCCDPLEPEYGSSTVAKVFFNSDSTIINSMAHGGRIFVLAKVKETAEEAFGDEVASTPSQSDAAKVEAAKALIAGNANQDRHATAFATLYADKLLYAHDTGKWYGYRDGRWLADELGKVRNLIRGTCRGGSSKAKTAAHHSAVESMCKADPVFAIMASAVFDRNNYLLNTPGGVVDLLTGKLLPHAPELMLSKVARVAPALGDHAPVFTKFLDEITGGDKELAYFLQVSLGACLSGAVESHWLLFWIGTGRNGKNTLGDLVMWIMGEYAKKVPATVLMAKDHEGHPTEMANLMGARLVVSSEIEQGAFWQEAKLNELTGDGTISARFMRQDFFEFIRTHKHLVFGNNRPRLKTVTEALKARIKIVPFNVSFIGREDPDLPTKLQTEGTAVLRWLIDGHLEWLRLGKRLPACAAVEAESANYFSNQSVVEMWMAEHLLIVEDDGRAARGWPEAKPLYDDYVKWKLDRGEKPLSMTLWGEAMAKRFEKVKAGGYLRYRGCLLDPARFRGCVVADFGDEVKGA